jgi:predicted transcriptional regulator
MRTVQEIEKAMQQLTTAELIELRERLDALVEDELELSEEFKASIERGQRDIAEGRVRIHQPEA